MCSSLARNLALEQRLNREGGPEAREAAAAVRRVIAGLAEDIGIELHRDDRGDRWALLDGRAIAFLGNDDAAASRDG